jgi:hexosaminidase
MSHAVIPAPVRFEVSAGREFVFRPGTAVGYADAGLAPVVERFCSQVNRRTGLRLAPTAGAPAPDKPSFRIELGSAGELAPVAAPAGVSPAGHDPADERYSLEIDGDQVVLRAVGPAGVARGLTTLMQLMVTSPTASAGEIRLPGARISDGPGYAWRGLSLDLARTWLTVAEIRRVIDLLELYKFNVLHLHLTDDQSWRLAAGRPAGEPEPGALFYSGEDLRGLVAYAADRFVTVVPEIDTPGHVSALVRLRPELDTGRNHVEFEFPPGQKHRIVWLDPQLPATFELIERVLADLAAIFPGPYIHIGGDEARGMPDDQYASYVNRLRGLVRSLGRRPLGWQETARAGLSADDIVQYWLTDFPLSSSLPPRVRALAEAELAMSRRDVESIAATSVPVIVSPLSHCYFDVPYAEPPADPADRAQADRQGRVGLRVYAPQTVAESFDWVPAETLGPGRDAQVAGIEAAIWSETIADFDDLTFLLLPRLAGLAHKAWSAAHPDHRDDWAAHRARLARHGRLWDQDDLTYFRSSTVDWF